MPSESWTNRFSFIKDPASTKHKVGSQEIDFLPVSGMMLVELRGIVDPVSKALNVLLADTRSDRGSTHREFLAEDGGVGGNEIIAQPLDENVIRFRATQREKAINDLVNALTRQENLEAIAKIILNSIRKSFNNDSPAPPPHDFVQQVPLPQFIEFCVGVFKANEGVFSPLGLTGMNLGSKVQDMLKDRVDPTQAPAEEGSQPSVADVAGTVRPATKIPGTN